MESSEEVVTEVTAGRAACEEFASRGDVQHSDC
jgi:hypothetical protein